MSIGNASAPLLTRSIQEAEPAKEPSIDDVIEKYMGATGVLQLLKAVLVAFAWAMDAQQVFISAFTDAEPRWHCLAASTTGGCSPASSPCALPPGSWAWDRPAAASVVSEWALGCAGPALVSLPASSFFAGCLAGGFLLATLADSLLGRKTMLVVSLASMSVAGALTALAPNVWAYAALRFASGFSRSMVGTCALVLSTELVGESRRGTVSVASFLCFALGFLSLPAIAYALRDASWRDMYLCTSLPCLCYSVLVGFLVQESPRWLLVRGRKQDAVEALRQLNGRSRSRTTAAGFSMAMLELDAACAGTSTSGGGDVGALRAMWERPWALRRLAAIMAASFGVGMVYFGMPLNVGSLLDGGSDSDLYLSVAYNALAEVPSAALAWLLIGRADRRGSVVALAAAAGACSLACAAIPPGVAAARMAAEVVSFFAACAALDVVLVYATELFPTSVRNSAVGLVRQSVVLGGATAPVLIALGRHRQRGSFWSFGVFGVAIGCSGLFVACLPETRGKSMSDTMDEEEERNHTAAAATAGGTDCDSGIV
ncbi:unnamed protein product [Urochloa decumbens]|uniref:H(+)/Pi cotransporter n=1 Tax=Urochloa decumbens TaxID=240449 RepID=A0ABC9AQ88_9POAL